VLPSDIDLIQGSCAASVLQFKFSTTSLLPSPVQQRFVPCL